MLEAYKLTDGSVVRLLYAANVSSNSRAYILVHTKVDGSSAIASPPFEDPLEAPALLADYCVKHRHIRVA